MHHCFQISNKNPDIKRKGPKQINALWSSPPIFIITDLHKVKKKKKKLPVIPDVIANA